MQPVAQGSVSGHSPRGSIILRPGRIILFQGRPLVIVHGGTHVATVQDTNQWHHMLINTPLGWAIHDMSRIDVVPGQAVSSAVTQTTSTVPTVPQSAPVQASVQPPSVLEQPAYPRVSSLIQAVHNQDWPTILQHITTLESLTWLPVGITNEVSAENQRYFLFLLFQYIPGGLRWAATQDNTFLVEYFLQRQPPSAKDIERELSRALDGGRHRTVEALLHYVQCDAHREECWVLWRIVLDFLAQKGMTKSPYLDRMANLGYSKPRITALLVILLLIHRRPVGVGSVNLPRHTMQLITGLPATQVSLAQDLLLLVTAEDRDYLARTAVQKSSNSILPLVKYLLEHSSGPQAILEEGGNAELQRWVNARMQ
jgi:hypothetical protein